MTQVVKDVFIIYDAVLAHIIFILMMIGIFGSASFRRQVDLRLRRIRSILWVLSLSAVLTMILYYYGT